MSTEVPSKPHLVSVVIPVYKGELTLAKLIGEIVGLTDPVTSPGGNQWRVTEVLLVFDNGPDRSADVIRELAAAHEFVRAVWLSGNFGQHSATLAGMASSGSEWIATIDEDGQHDPVDIGVLIDSAIHHYSPVVYAKPINRPPHGLVRNMASKSAKLMISRLAGGQDTTEFQSFRLVLGEIGRSVAAYSGAGVYLDVALSWVTPRTSTADVTFRDEGQRSSGYSPRKLVSHFWRLVLSSGTRALRIVTVLGALFAVAGLGLAIVFTAQRLVGGDLPAGWASTITVILVASGAVLFSLGIIAEYLGVAVNMAMGKPPYLVVSDLRDGPLGNRDSKV